MVPRPPPAHRSGPLPTTDIPQCPLLVPLLPTPDPWPVHAVRGFTLPGVPTTSGPSPVCPQGAWVAGGGRSWPLLSWATCQGRLQGRGEQPAVAVPRVPRPAAAPVRGRPVEELCLLPEAQPGAPQASSAQLCPGRDSRAAWAWATQRAAEEPTLCPPWHSSQKPPSTTLTLDPSGQSESDLGTSVDKPLYTLPHTHPTSPTAPMQPLLL